MICASRAPLAGPWPGPCELPVSHLAQPASGFVCVPSGRGGAAAGSLHVGLRHIELAVAQLGHGMNVGIVVDAHARRDFGYIGVRPQFELRGHWRRILVDDQRDPQHAAAVIGRKPGAQGDGNDRRILGAVRHLDADDLGAIVHRTIVEDVLDKAGPRIIGLGRCRRRNVRAEHDAECAGDALAMQSRRKRRPGMAAVLRWSASTYGIGRAIPIQFPKMPLLHCARCSRRTVAIATARRPQRCRRRPLSARHGR